MRLVMNYTTDEREEKSQKDKADTIFIGYVFLSNRTKLFFWRHLFFLSCRWRITVSLPTPPAREAAL